MSYPVLQTDIPGLKLLARGKVRDLFDLGDSLLLVASDRISAYDVIMPNGIPDKGRVLTQMSRYWFRRLRPLVSTHYITVDDAYIRSQILERGGEMGRDLAGALAGRCTLAVKAEPFPVECVVRGYISGSLWKEYCDAGGTSHGITLHGIDLPAGLRESDRLPEAVFTPATKAQSGHDINIGMAETSKLVGAETAERLKDISLSIYSAAAEMALRNGMIIADTKFEFGMHAGGITLIDEVLTPDSSRFWDQKLYAPGSAQRSFDKQFVRAWLTQSGWNREPPAPELPHAVVAQTSEKYREAYRRVVGEPLPA